MKKALGLILLCFLASASADVLILRGHVPPSYKVKTIMEKGHPRLKLETNEKRGRGGPRLTSHKIHQGYSVTLRHP